MKSIAATALLLASCAAAPAPPPQVAASVPPGYQTQDTCHPDVPLLDTGQPGVVAPKVLSKVEPVVPEAVRAARVPVDDLVIVEPVIDASGSVSDVCVLKGDLTYAQNVIDAVKQWKFVPGTIDGHPSAFRTNMTVKFRLQ